MQTDSLLYAATVSCLSDQGLYASACAAVSPERRERCACLASEEARFRSLGAAVLLQKALRDFGCSDCRTAVGSHGKPFLKNGPFFNLSHSGDWVLCAVSPFEVGCDIEQIKPFYPSFARRFFTQEEYADILAQPSPAEQAVRFFRYWTLKESFLKATGLGLSLPLNAFRIVLGKNVSVLQDADPRTFFFAEYEDLPGCACSLCTAASPARPPLRRWDLAELLSR